MQGEPERCRAAGMDDFAAKPTTIPFLAAKLRQLAAAPRRGPSSRRRAAERGAAGDGALDRPGARRADRRRRRARRRVLADFLGTSREPTCGRSTTALEAHDSSSVRRQAHRIKGAARIVGARRLERPAQRIEAIARDGGGWDELPPLAAEIGSLLDAELRAGDQPQPAPHPGR